MLLYDYTRSSACYRVRIALALKGIEPERHNIMLLENQQRDPAYLARNPQGLIPALAVGDRLLTQSYAIIDWLDAAHPDPLLIPVEPGARAAAIARTMVIAADVHPLNNLRVQRWLETELGADADARRRWMHHWMAEGFAALEAMAAADAAAVAAGPFLGGAAPDISDVYLVPQLVNARRFGLALDAYPRLRAAEAACLALDAFATTHPDRSAAA